MNDSIEQHFLRLKVKHPRPWSERLTEEGRVLVEDARGAAVLDVSAAYVGASPRLVEVRALALLIVDNANGGAR